MQHDNLSPVGKGADLPIQKLLKGEFIRVIPWDEQLDSLSSIPHRHDHYELFYINVGEGVHYLNYKKYEITPGRAYFIQPGQVHLIENFKGAGWLFMFGQEFFNRFLTIHRYEDEMGLLDAYSPCPYVDISPAQQIFLDQIISLTSASLSRPDLHDDLLLHYMSIILLEMNRWSVAQHLHRLGTSTSRSTFARLKSLIEVNLLREHRAAFYAKQMKIDIKKLNKICAAHTRHSLSGLLKERLITESKILIKVSDLSIKEISYHLGFSDPAFFGRFFKQQTGLTPAEFQKRQVF